MKEWFELLTDRSSDEIASLTDAQQTHPMQAKKLLGTSIVSFYGGTEAASKAQAEWEKQFPNAKTPMK